MHFYLPDTLARWPWPRAINPAYEECKIASTAWCEKYKAFSPKAQKAFNLCDFNLLASLAYAGQPREVNRVGCDLMNLFFVYDEHSDAMDADSVSVWADIIMDALRNPHKARPHGEPIVGEITRSFWLNAMKHLGPTAQRRFIETFDTYTQAVVVQASDRDHKTYRGVESYFEVRRDTIGAKPSYALLEHDMELPDEVFNHPSVSLLRDLSIDMIILGNDITSYNVEQSRGDDGHNIVKLAMLENQTDLEGAMNFVSNLHDRLLDTFLDTAKNLPSFGATIDAWLVRYIDGLGNWVRASDSWSFESWRYFKGEGLTIQRERRVELLPPASKSELTSSIPPESRWIRPVVHSNLPRPQSVGIMALDTFPEFSNAVKHDCATAVSSFFVKYSIDPRSVGRIEISTIHSPTDDLVSDVCGLFNSLDSGDIEAVVSRQAALSLLNAVNWVESKSWDGRFALVVIDDVNVVNSLLIGPNAPIILDPGYGVAWHNGETNVHGGSLDQSVFQKAVRQRSSKILGKGPESPSLNPPLEYIIFQGSNGRGESPQTLKAVAQDVLSSVRDFLCVKDTKQAIEGSAVFSSLPELIGSKDLASNTAFGLFDIGERAVLFLVLRIAGDYSVMSQHLQHRIVEGYYSSSVENCSETYGDWLKWFWSRFTFF